MSRASIGWQILTIGLAGTLQRRLRFLLSRHELARELAMRAGRMGRLMPRIAPTVDRAAVEIMSEKVLAWKTQVKKQVCAALRRWVQESCSRNSSLRQGLLRLVARRLSGLPRRAVLQRGGCALPVPAGIEEPTRQTVIFRMRKDQGWVDGSCRIRVNSRTSLSNKQLLTFVRHSQRPFAAGLR